MKGEFTGLIGEYGFARVVDGDKSVSSWYGIETRAERIPETIEWFPTHVPMPKQSSVDAATAAITDLLTAIRNPTPSSPFASIDTEKL